MTPPTLQIVSWQVNWRRAGNKALARVAEIEGKTATHDAAAPLAGVDPAALATLAADLKTVWMRPQPMRG